MGYQYVFKALLLLFSAKGVISITCKNEGTDHCTNWACTNVGTLGTCSTVSGGAISTRCSRVYSFDMNSSDEFEYDKSAACNTGTSTATDCLFSGTYTAECREYCTDNDCNQNLYSVSPRPALPAGSTSCVQCTSHTADSSCFSTPPDATLCNGGISEQYCTTLHAVSLGADGRIADQVVFRGCSASLHEDGCSAGPLAIGGVDYSRAITCSKSCSGTGCNNQAVPLAMDLDMGSGLTCKYCMNTMGPCATLSDMICPSSQSYCYTKMVYTKGSGYLDGALTIVSEERGCTDSEMTSQCTTVASDIINSNIETKSCQETCKTDNCNEEAFPNRPRCSQCYGSYYDDSGNLIPEDDPRHFKWCRENPPMPKACPDISYTHCFVYQKYIPEGDNEVKLGYSKEFRRGCLQESSWSKCMKRNLQDGRKASDCQFVCNEDDCNLGSGASEVTLGALTLMAAFSIRQILF